ncbi:hypothetical protein [Dentiradicibacter hellwigii]|uniref:Uncharacterized protein n=1 Tax=Dentiradicibacter hellwigii TaxID=3149053 RepID=A0ABV4UHQ5_9RHOO
MEKSTKKKRNEKSQKNKKQPRRRCGKTVTASGVDLLAAVVIVVVFCIVFYHPRAVPAGFHACHAQAARSPGESARRGYISYASTKKTTDNERRTV